MRRRGVRCSGGENLRWAASAILLPLIGETCDEGVSAIGPNCLAVF